MKSIIYIIIISLFSIIYGQTADVVKKNLQEAGMNKDQIDEVINSQRNNINKLKSDSKNIDVELDISNETYVQQNKINENQNIEIESFDNDAKESIDLIAEKRKSLNFFGYQIFKGDPSAFQSSTFGAVDPNYNIGPGDKIIVMLWGESQFRQEFTVDLEGYVFIPEVGQVFVNGLNLETLEKKFFQILSKVYSTLKPSSGEPTTFMDISLGNLRPLRIIVLGEVEQPGAYSVSPSTSLSSSLYYFQGPTTNGSLRDIRLIRKDKQIGSIDFYNYLLSGNTPKDLRLQLDDVVFIPPRGKTVSIIGEINRQGIYELTNDEKLDDLINYAGNLKNTAYIKRAQISRIVPFSDREEIGMERMLIDINLESILKNKYSMDLFDGDTLTIFPIEKLEENYVKLLGSSIARPGVYELLPNMRLMDLINNANGLLNDAFLNTAHIIRKNKNLTNDILTINLNKAKSGDLSHNLKLQYMDEVIIYNKNSLSNNFQNIFIDGPVKFPGNYELTNNKVLSDIILEAGGFLNGIKKVKISVTRINYQTFEPIIYNFPSKSSQNLFITLLDIKNDNNEINSFNLKENDIINIYSDPKDVMSGTVTIEGSVYFPGKYTIRSQNEKVTEIINRAGGLMKNAYPLASTLYRNNNLVKLSFEEIISNPKSKNNFNVSDGDIINIQKRSNIVTIIGEVNNPGLFKFYKNYSVKDYIEIAGGLTPNAEKRQVWISYPNGTSKQLKRYSVSPQVFDGSTINIGQKEASDPIDRTELAKEMASIISDFLQIALTISILSRAN